MDCGRSEVQLWFERGAHTGRVAGKWEHSASGYRWLAMVSLSEGGLLKVREYATNGKDDPNLDIL